MVSKCHDVASTGHSAAANHPLQWTVAADVIRNS